MLRIIERATRQPIEAMNLPTVQDVNLRRLAKFKQEITAAMASQDGEPYRAVLEECVRETGTNLHGSEINRIDIREDHTLVQLPADILARTLKHLRKIRVRGQPLGISRIEGRSRS